MPVGEKIPHMVVYYCDVIVIVRHTLHILSYLRNRPQLEEWSYAVINHLLFPADGATKKESPGRNICSLASCQEGNCNISL